MNKIERENTIPEMIKDATKDKIKTDKEFIFTYTVIGNNANYTYTVSNIANR